MKPKLIKISPSSLAFRDCERCYWLKVNKKIQQPSIPMPGVLHGLHSVLADFTAGCDVQKLIPTDRKGIIAYKSGTEVTVKSESLYFNAGDQTVSNQVGIYLSGRLDKLIEFDDGSIGIIDFKSSSVLVDAPGKSPSPYRAGHLKGYGLQMNSYAYAKENPLKGRSALVSELWIMAIRPVKAKFPDDIIVELDGVPHVLDLSDVEVVAQGDGFTTKMINGVEIEWRKQCYKIEKDYTTLTTELKGIYEMLQKLMPPLNGKCAWCKRDMQIAGLAN